MSTHFVLAICLLMLCLPIQAQPADNAIVGLTANRSAQHVEVRIDMQDTLEQMPTHFSTADPARIVLDLPVRRAANNQVRTRDNFPSADNDIVTSYALAHADARTRLVLNLSRSAAYSISINDRSLVVRIDAAPTVQRHNEELLSVNLRKVEVRALLQMLADIAGMNIVISDSVSGTLSLHLREVSWQHALEIIVQTRALEMRRQGQVLWIAPRAELLNKEKNILEQQAQMADLEPLLTEVFQLNYQKAESFRKLFGVGQSDTAAAHPHMLSRRGSTLVDARTNQLFVTDTRRVLDNVRTLLAKVDVPSRQVLIEARIVEADDAFSRNLGMRLGFSAGMPRQPDNPAHQRDAAINLPASPLGAFEAGSFALSLFNARAQRFLNLELSALEADGKGQIISSPRVVTADQQAALIEQGEEIPYQQSTSSGATSVAFKKANLKLEVTPQITPDGNVILTVDISKDSRGVSTPGGLAINTKHVNTKVQVEDGGTVVIGGIYTQAEQNASSKVPLLGDLPLLGWLFRNSEKVTSKTELLVFLTPKIVATGNFQQ